MMSAPFPYPVITDTTSPLPDDAQINTVLPSICVDYLSHNWDKDEQIWASWKAMTKSKNEITNGVRLENASWRTWAKQRGKLKTISPETLNWLKDSDVTYLYGPLHETPRAVPPPKEATFADRLGLDETDSAHLRAPGTERTPPRSNTASPALESRIVESDSSSSAAPVTAAESASARTGASRPSRGTAPTSPTSSVRAPKSILKHRTISDVLGGRTGASGRRDQSPLGTPIQNRRAIIYSVQSDTNLVSRGLQVIADAASADLSDSDTALRQAKDTAALNEAAPIPGPSSASGSSDEPLVSSSLRSSSSTSGSVIDLIFHSRNKDARPNRHISFNHRVEQCIALDDSDPQDRRSIRPAVAPHNASAYSYFFGDSDDDDGDDDDDDMPGKRRRPPAVRMHAHDRDDDDDNDIHDDFDAAFDEDFDIRMGMGDGASGYRHSYYDTSAIAPGGLPLHAARRRGFFYSDSEEEDEELDSDSDALTMGSSSATSPRTSLSEPADAAGAGRRPSTGGGALLSPNSQLGDTQPSSMSGGSSSSSSLGSGKSGGAHHHHHHLLTIAKLAPTLLKTSETYPAPSPAVVDPTGYLLTLPGARRGSHQDDSEEDDVEKEARLADEEEEEGGADVGVDDKAGLVTPTPLRVAARREQGAGSPTPRAERSFAAQQGHLHATAAGTQQDDARDASVDSCSSGSGSAGTAGSADAHAGTGSGRSRPSARNLLLDSSDDRSPSPADVSSRRSSGSAGDSDLTIVGISPYRGGGEGAMYAGPSSSSSSSAAGRRPDSGLRHAYTSPSTSSSSSSSWRRAAQGSSSSTFSTASSTATATAEFNHYGHHASDGPSGPVPIRSGRHHTHRGPGTPESGKSGAAGSVQTASPSQPGSLTGSFSSGHSSGSSVVSASEGSGSGDASFATTAAAAAGAAAGSSATIPIPGGSVSAPATHVPRVHGFREGRYGAGPVANVPTLGPAVGSVGGGGASGGVSLSSSTSSSSLCSLDFDEAGNPVSPSGRLERGRSRGRRCGPGSSSSFDRLSDAAQAAYATALASSGSGGPSGPGGPGGPGPWELDGRSRSRSGSAHGGYSSSCSSSAQSWGSKMAGGAGGSGSGSGSTADEGSLSPRGHGSLYRGSVIGSSSSLRRHGSSGSGSGTGTGGHRSSQHRGSNDGRSGRGSGAGPPPTRGRSRTPSYEQISKSAAGIQIQIGSASSTSGSSAGSSRRNSLQNVPVVTGPHAASSSPMTTTTPPSSVSSSAVQSPEVPVKHSRTSSRRTKGDRVIAATAAAGAAATAIAKADADASQSDSTPVLLPRKSLPGPPQLGDGVLGSPSLGPPAAVPATATVAASQPMHPRLGSSAILSANASLTPAPGTPVGPEPPTTSTSAENAARASEDTSAGPVASSASSVSSAGGGKVAGSVLTAGGVNAAAGSGSGSAGAGATPGSTPTMRVASSKRRADSAASATSSPAAAAVAAAAAASATSSSRRAGSVSGSSGAGGAAGQGASSGVGGGAAHGHRRASSTTALGAGVHSSASTLGSKASHHAHSKSHGALHMPRSELGAGDAAGSAPTPGHHAYEVVDDGGPFGRAVEFVNTARDLVSALWGGVSSGGRTGFSGGR